MPNPMDRNRKRVTVTLDSGVYERLAQLAKEDQDTVEDLLNKMLNSSVQQAVADRETKERRAAMARKARERLGLGSSEPIYDTPNA